MFVLIRIAWRGWLGSIKGEERAARNPQSEAGVSCFESSYSKTRDAVARSHGGQVAATPGSGDLAQNQTGHTTPGFAVT